MIVLDSFALRDANIEDDVLSPAGRIIDTDICFITPVALAESYMIVKNNIGTEIADAILESVLSKRGNAIVVDDKDPALIRHAIEIIERYGVSYPVAFTAALAILKGCPVLSNDQEFDELNDDGVCIVRRY